MLQLQMDRIDQTSKDCVQRALRSEDSIVGEQSCRQQAIKSWDDAMNDNYQFLMRNTTGATKNALVEAQRQWIHSRDEEFKFLDLKWKSKDIAQDADVEKPHRRALEEKTAVIKKQAEWLHDVASDLFPPF